MQQKITLIAAMAHHRVIGFNNQIPWHIAEDFVFFKQYTIGKPVIMGRKTWHSLPRRPLPNRRNIVLTQQKHWQDEGAEVFFSLDEAIAACVAAPEIIIMGGAEIYRQSLPIATDLRLTEIDLSTSGDAYFPEFSRQDWQEISRDKHIAQNGLAFDFVHYTRAATQKNEFRLK